MPGTGPGLIWFTSQADTELVQSLGMGEDAQYVVNSDAHDVHASLRGKLYHLHDDAKLVELWSPVIAVWFEGGRKDPRVVYLRFDPELAELWASSSLSLKFGFEIIRATLDPGRQPDIGAKSTVKFPKLA